MKIRKSTAHYVTNRGTIPSNPSAMKTSILSLAAVIASLNGTTAWVPKSSSTNVVGRSLLSSIPRGGANEYETTFESVKCSVIEKANRKVRSVGSCLLVFVRMKSHMMWWFNLLFCYGGGVISFHGSPLQILTVMLNAIIYHPSLTFTHTYTVSYSTPLPHASYHCLKLRHHTRYTD